MDKKELYEAINNFKFWSTPSNGIGSSPATVDDINKVIAETARLASIIVKAIEK